MKAEILILLFKDDEQYRKRVENMLKKCTNNMKIGFLVIYIVVVAILGSFITACQPTPEELIVQNKADDELMEAINSENPTVTSTTSTDLQEQAQTKEILDYKIINYVEFEEELSNGVKLEANSDITIPDVESFPVVSYKRKELTQAVVDNMIQAAIGDSVLYESSSGGEWTKSEIEDMIVKINYEYNNLQSAIAIIKGITDLEELHRQRDEILSGLYEKLETAPDTLSLVVHSGEVEGGYIKALTTIGETMALVEVTTESYENSTLGINISLYDNVGNPIKSTIQAMRVDGNLVSIEQTIEEDMGQKVVLGEDLELLEVTSQPQSINMSPDEAIELAETTFKNMGAGDNVKVSNIYYLEIPEKNKNCYAIELKRYVDNMPIEIIRSNNVGMEKRATDATDEFNSGVPNERMSVFISDEGIIDIEWREPIEIVEILNTSVSLIESEKIIEVFKQEFKNSYTYYTDEDPLPYELDQIKLSYGLARIADSNDLFMAIPLWDFYAGQKQIREWTTYYGENEVIESYSYGSMLTINAIDGSRFSRSWGY